MQLDLEAPQWQNPGYQDLTATSLTLNSGVPQGFVLSPFMYSLFTLHCSTRHNINCVTEYADNSTVLCLSQWSYSLLGGSRTPSALEASFTGTSARQSIDLGCRKLSFEHRSSLSMELVYIEVDSLKLLKDHITQDLSWTFRSSTFLKMLTTAK